LEIAPGDRSWSNKEALRETCWNYANCFPLAKLVVQDKIWSNSIKTKGINNYCMYVYIYLHSKYVLITFTTQTVESQKCSLFFDSSFV